MASGIRHVLASTAVLAAAAALVPGGSAGLSAAGSRAITPTLYVQYTMNCTFTITDDNHQTVSSIPPGTYQVQITTPVVFADVDLSGTSDMTACKSFVQFQLTGPGVSISTTLQEGDEDYGIVSATFRPSASYTAVDLNQPSVARAVFATTATGTPASPTAPYSSTASGKGTASTDIVGSSAESGSSADATTLRGTLAGSVSAAGKVALTSKGQAVSSLRAGRYTIVVTDRSRKSGFVIQQSHKVATSVSGGSFVGKKTVSVDLKAGRWFFYPSFIGTKTFFIVTA